MMEMIRLDRDLRLNPKNRKVVICCPVGNSQMFDSFVKMIHKLGISMDTNLDFLFVAPPELKFSPLYSTLSAIYFRENIVRLGTSGSFFACQVKAYELGYEYIVMADIDVEMDDPKVLYDCIKMAQNEDKIIMPQCRARTTSDNTVSSSVWGFGVFPRFMLEKHGFCTPYFWKGAEDYDYNCRVAKDKVEYRGGMIYHPRIGNNYYLKAEYPRKFYPYLGSLMRSFLLLKKYPEYILWYVYNSFLAKIFCDEQLDLVMERTDDMTNLNLDIVNNNTLFKITKVKDQATTEGKIGMLVSMAKSIFCFLKGQPFYTYTEKVVYMGDRASLLGKLLWTIIISPFFIVGALLNIVSWDGKHGFQRNAICYPVYPSNVSEAEKWCLNHFPKQEKEGDEL